jgi:hypothetical protein
MAPPNLSPSYIMLKPQQGCKVKLNIPHYICSEGQSNWEGNVTDNQHIVCCINSLKVHIAYQRLKSPSEIFYCRLRLVMLTGLCEMVSVHL